MVKAEELTLRWCVTTAYTGVLPKVPTPLSADSADDVSDNDWLLSIFALLLAFSFLSTKIPASPKTVTSMRIKSNSESSTKERFLDEAGDKFERLLDPTGEYLSEVEVFFLVEVGVVFPLEGGRALLATLVFMGDKSGPWQFSAVSPSGIIVVLMLLMFGVGVFFLFGVGVFSLFEVGRALLAMLVLIGDKAGRWQLATAALPADIIVVLMLLVFEVGVSFLFEARGFVLFEVGRALIAALVLTGDKAARWKFATVCPAGIIVVFMSLIFEVGVSFMFEVRGFVIFEVGRALIAEPVLMGDKAGR